MTLMPARCGCDWPESCPVHTRERFEALEAENKRLGEALAEYAEMMALQGRRVPGFVTRALSG